MRTVEWAESHDGTDKRRLRLVTRVSVVCNDDGFLEAAEIAAEALGVRVNQTDSANYALVFGSDRVMLRQLSEAIGADIYVDFCRGSSAFRRFRGGGLGQPVAKAVGVSGSFKPLVFDATAGLGEDAFVLASLGCTVMMAERSPVAHALLRDGLKRASEFAHDHGDIELDAIMQRMTLLPVDSIAYLHNSQSTIADVVYLDPMFPPRQKSSAVKKNMAVFHRVIGVDEDGSELLDAALKAARYRVAVKRSRSAPMLANKEPSVKHMGKSSRFDIYALKALPKRVR